MKYNEEGQELTVDSDQVRFVTVLDPHFSPTTPASRKDDYFEFTKGQFRQVLKFSRKMNASALLLAGDVFHLKSASKCPPWFVREMVSLMLEAQDMGIQVLGIAGNHDVVFGSIESLDKQPLGVLMGARAFHLLDNKPVLVKANGFSVKISGGSYKHSQVDHVMSATKDGADYLIALGHFWYGGATGEFYGEQMYGADYLKNSEVDIYVIGHHHVDQGILHENGKFYVSHGSMSWVGSHSDNLSRRPAVGMLTITKDTVKPDIVRLKVPPPEDVFDLEAKQQMADEQKQLDAFINTISNYDVVSVDPINIADSMGLPDKVRAKVQEYLDKSAELTT